MKTNKPTPIQNSEPINVRAQDADIAEALSLGLKELADALRDPNVPKSEIYYRSYHLRHTLGRIVAHYGAGVPKP